MSNVGRGSPWRPTQAGSKMNLSYANRLRHGSKHGNRHGITSETSKGGMLHGFTEKQTIAKHGRH